MQKSAHVNTYGVNICMFSERLKEVRASLGLNQSDFGELMGAKKRTVVDWEKGVSSPTALQLIELAKHEVDINYLMTGELSNPIPAGLPADEQLLLDSYRALPVAQRRTMLASLLSGDIGVEKKTSAKSKKGNVLQATGNGNVQIGGNNDK